MELATAWHLAMLERSVLRNRHLTRGAAWLGSVIGMERILGC